MIKHKFILFRSYDRVSIKAVCLQTIVVIVEHDYVHFVVGFTNTWAQLYGNEECKSFNVHFWKVIEEHDISSTQSFVVHCPGDLCRLNFARNMLFPSENCNFCSKKPPCGISTSRANRNRNVAKNFLRDNSLSRKPCNCLTENTRFTCNILMSESAVTCFQETLLNVKIRQERKVLNHGTCPVVQHVVYKFVLYTLSVKRNWSLL